MITGKIKIELRKATELAGTRTTVSSIRQDFENNTFPFFYHSYNPNNSFVAVPAEWLKELAENANDFNLANEIENQIQKTKGAKEDIIKRIRQIGNKGVAPNGPCVSWGSSPHTSTK